MDALVREIKEESGIDIQVSKLVAISSNTVTYEGYNGVKVVPTKVMMDFSCKFIAGALSTSEETPESKWVNKEEVLNDIKSPNIVERFKAYLNFEGHVTYMEYVTRPAYKLKIKRKI